MNHTGDELDEIHALIKEHGPFAAGAIMRSRDQEAKDLKNAELALLDRYAIAALPALIGLINETDAHKTAEHLHAQLAKNSYDIADAMLLAREKKEAK